LRSIEISEETFRRLRQAAQSDETSELVIRRLLDAGISASELDGRLKEKEKTLAEWETQLSQREMRLSGKLRTPSSDNDIRSYIADNPPHSVTHTKVFKATLDGRAVPHSALNWASLICEMLKIIYRRGQFLGSRGDYGINICDGKKQDKGFVFVPAINCSVQNVDANSALRCIAGLAQTNSISVDLTFGWRDKKGALHPGEYGRILIEP